jgi:TonB family protein
MLFLALSLCNLMGRRSANNSNTNTASPESSPAEGSNTQVEERREIDSSRPSGPQSQNPMTSRNSNAAAPPVALDEPPPPPKKGFTPSPQPKIISGGVLNGKAISLPKPAYPAIAKAAHASGTVMVQVTIDENGNVISAHPISGHPLLQSAAASAARQAKFSPTKLSGQPVKITGVITYNFVAQ